MKNAIIAQWDQGYVEAVDSASVSTYDAREGVLNASSIADIDIVDQLADQNLAIVATPDESIVATIEDTDPTSGWSTYGAFGIGDRVTAPTMAGGTQTVRCVGITVAEDGDGYLDVVTEWGTVRDLAEERQQRWLSRTDNGTLDGRSPTPVVSVSSPSIVSSAVVSPRAITFSTDGSYAPEVGDTAGPGKTPDGRGFLYRVEIDARVAGVDPTTVSVTVNGSSVCSASIGDASVSATYDLTYLELCLLERTDIVSVEITAAGGHEGVVVRCLYTTLEL